MELQASHLCTSGGAFLALVEAEVRLPTMAGEDGAVIIGATARGAIAILDLRCRADAEALFEGLKAVLYPAQTHQYSYATVVCAQPGCDVGRMPIEDGHTDDRMQWYCADHCMAEACVQRREHAKEVQQS